MILETSRLILRRIPRRRHRAARRTNGQPRFHALFARPIHARANTDRTAEIPLLEPGWFAFAVCGCFSRAITNLLGYCGFLHQHSDSGRRNRNRLPTGSRTIGTVGSISRGRERRAAITRFRRSKITRVISLIHPENIRLTSCGGEKWNGDRKRKLRFSRISDDVFAIVSGAMACGARRWMNSRASAR